MKEEGGRVKDEGSIPAAGIGMRDEGGRVKGGRW